jgi:hypothetical protein
MRQTAKSNTGPGLNQYSAQLRAEIGLNHQDRKRVIRTYNGFLKGG